MGSGPDTSEKSDEDMLCLSNTNCHSVDQRILKLFPREGSKIKLEPSPPEERECTGEVRTENCQKLAVEMNESPREGEVDDLLQKLIVQGADGLNDSGVKDYSQE